MLDGLWPAILVGYRHATKAVRQHYTTVSVLVTYILNDVAMITDEKESSAVRHIDLHPNQACKMLEPSFSPANLVETHHQCGQANDAK